MKPLEIGVNSRTFKLTVCSGLVLFCVIFNNCVFADPKKTSTCNLATLKGTYTFHVFGTEYGNTISSYIGMASFDGAGHGYLQKYTSGTPNMESGAGTYTVSNICHGVLANGDEKVVNPFGKILHFFVSPDGSLIQFTVKSPDTARWAAEAVRVTEEQILNASNYQSE